MSRGRLVALFLACLILGAIAGWMVRRWTQPSIEERAHGAADQVKTQVERQTR